MVSLNLNLANVRSDEDYIITSSKHMYKLSNITLWATSNVIINKKLIGTNSSFSKLDQRIRLIKPLYV